MELTEYGIQTTNFKDVFDLGCSKDIMLNQTYLNHQDRCPPSKDLCFSQEMFK